MGGGGSRVARSCPADPEDEEEAIDAVSSDADSFQEACCTSPAGDLREVSFDEDADWEFVDCPVVESPLGCGEGEEAIGPLDVDAFQHFSPLLAASQDYAGLSGCRFRSDFFRDIDKEPEEEPADAESLLAKRSAAHAVRSFVERLQAREPALLEEAEYAYRIVMAESVRNAMVATFRELDLWPPSPCPAGVGADDCSYEDLSAPFPVIAQRAWNDQMRRQRDAESQRAGGVGSLLRRAMTASYLVDFVHEAGVELPPEPEHQLAKLGQFTAKAEEWMQAGDENVVASGVSDASASGGALTTPGSCALSSRDLEGAASKESKAAHENTAANGGSDVAAPGGAQAAAGFCVLAARDLEVAASEKEKVSRTSRTWQEATVRGVVTVFYGVFYDLATEAGVSLLRWALKWHAEPSGPMRVDLDDSDDEICEEDPQPACTTRKSSQAAYVIDSGSNGLEPAGS